MYMVKWMMVLVVSLFGAAFANGTDFEAVRTALLAEWATGVGVVLGIFGLALGIRFVMARIRAAAK